MTPRRNIQATIDPSGAGRYLVSIWDDEGHRATYEVEAGDEQEAWQTALLKFEKELNDEGE